MASVDSRLKRCIGRTRESSIISIVLPPLLPLPLSDNHLGDTLSSERLTANEALPLESRDQIAHTSQEEENRRSEETCRLVGNQCKPLNQAHDTIHAGAHVVGCEAADEHIEFLRRWADAEEQGHFDENQDQAGYPANAVSRGLGSRSVSGG